MAEPAEGTSLFNAISALTEVLKPLAGDLRTVVQRLDAAVPPPPVPPPPTQAQQDQQQSLQQQQPNQQQMQPNQQTQQTQSQLPSQQSQQSQSQLPNQQSQQSQSQLPYQQSQQNQQQTQQNQSASNLNAATTNQAALQASRLRLSLRPSTTGPAPGNEMAPPLAAQLADLQGQILSLQQFTFTMSPMSSQLLDVTTWGEVLRTVSDVIPARRYLEQYFHRVLTGHTAQPNQSLLNALVGNMEVFVEAPQVLDMASFRDSAHALITELLVAKAKIDGLPPRHCRLSVRLCKRPGNPVSS